MTPAVELRGISKHFGGVTALDDVSLAIAPGVCHALVGENGAGKSTLGKIIAGIYRPDRGTLHLDGQQCRFATPRDALRAGVGMVHQELAFCPDLSVAENLALGRYPTRWGWLSRGAMERRAVELLGRIGVTLDVRQPLRRLSTAQEQMVQIAAALGGGGRVLIFDEPTSALSQSDAERLLTLLEQLRARGAVTLVYVSHRMPEIFRLADAITVLRDGRHVATVARGATDERGLVQMMIGRPLAEYFPQHLQRPVGAPVLSVRGLSLPGRVQDASLTVHAGEIVGLAGLVGAGRSELARAVFGLEARARGSVAVAGQALRLRSARAAMRAGIGLVPEDRKRQGLVLSLGCRVNFGLSPLPQTRWLGWLRQGRERRIATEYFERLNVRTPSIDARVMGLSGGNQQKVVLARWLARKLRVLIVDEPTRGVDVGAKAAIHALIDELAQAGLAVLLISSELPELLALSTRVVVMRGGRLVGELPRAAATQARVLELMAGVEPERHRT